MYAIAGFAGQLTGLQYFGTGLLLYSAAAFPHISERRSKKEGRMKGGQVMSSVSSLGTRLQLRPVALRLAYTVLYQGAVIDGKTPFSLNRVPQTEMAMRTRQE